MEVKLVRIPNDVHRQIAIQAATRGETIQAITVRALRLEIARINKTEQKKRVRKSDSLDSTISNEGAQRGNSSRTRR